MRRSKKLSDRVEEHGKAAITRPSFPSKENSGGSTIANFKEHERERKRATGNNAVIDLHWRGSN